MIKKREQYMTDMAWDNLYERLQRDNLIVTDSPRKSVATFRAGWIIIASIILSIPGGWWISKQMNNKATKIVVIHNDKNESTLVTTLEDGSVVYLSGETSIICPDHFDSNKREISLKGEAFFNINSNRERPFYIETIPVRVEVTGTAFSVRNTDMSSFCLSVRKGEVTVTLKKNRQIVHVHQGETVLLKSDHLHLSTNKNNIFDSYWHKIHFKDERLADVIRIINMNTTSAQLQITPELADMRLTVSFSNNNEETMAKLICLALGLQYTSTQQTIHIAAN
jgi:ferric-dicitrate binding protein FerR (iron transport regulator)